MSNQVLKPCPFCKREIEVVRIGGGWFWRHKGVDDSECVIMHSRKYETEAEAIARWNGTCPDDYSQLTIGDPIFYLFDDTGEIEAGEITSLLFDGDVLQSIGVRFDNDADEFYGSAMGTCLFTSRHRAQRYYQTITK